jgi:hypothetical protein
LRPSLQFNGDCYRHRPPHFALRHLCSDLHAVYLGPIVGSSHLRRNGPPAGLVITSSYGGFSPYPKSLKPYPSFPLSSLEGGQTKRGALQCGRETPSVWTKLNRSWRRGHPLNLEASMAHIGGTLFRYTAQLTLAARLSWPLVGGSQEWLLVLGVHPRGDVRHEQNGAHGLP